MNRRELLGLSVSAPFLLALDSKERSIELEDFNIGRPYPEDVYWMSKGGYTFTIRDFSSSPWGSSIPHQDYPYSLHVMKSGKVPKPYVEHVLSGMYKSLEETMLEVNKLMEVYQ